MKKLLALYTTPADAEAFMGRYRDGHLPLVKKIPGLVSADVTRIDRTLVGEAGAFLLCEMCFADSESFKAAMKSPEMAAVTDDAGKFADGIVTVMSATALDL